MIEQNIAKGPFLRYSLSPHKSYNIIFLIIKASNQRDKGKGVGKVKMNITWLRNVLAQK